MIETQLIKIWTKPVREEIIGVLWLIAGLLSKISGNPSWVNWIFFTMGLIAMALSIKYIRESKHSTR